MDVTKILESRSYTKLLYGSYAENPTWVEFMNCITEVFNESFGKQLIQLVNVNVPDKSSREINISHAKNMGFDLRNSFFTNEEYIALIENLKLYEKKKGTKHFISILGLIKSAHFNIYQLWTSDYKTFKRESYWVTNNSILKDYTRVLDNTSNEINYGSVLNEPKRTVDYGLVTDKAVNTVSYGEVLDVLLDDELPNINDPEFYKNKYYPTSHVDIDYDVEKYPIKEDDIRYLFYKLAPANLVLHTIDGVVYVDSVELYIAPVGDFEQSYDTFVGWAMYEGELYTFPLCQEHSVVSGLPELKYRATKESLLENINWYDRCYDKLPLNVDCYRDSVAWYLDDNRDIHSVPKNTLRYLDNKGILLEPRATNLIKYSTRMEEKRIILNSGTYTFSSYGKPGSRIYIEGPFPSQYLYTNETFTFTINTDNTPIYLYPEVSVRNLQLEKTTYATSPIINEENTATRATDTLATQNPSIRKSTVYFKFIKNKDDRKSWLFSYGKSFTNTIDAYYENGKVYIVQTNRNSVDIRYTTDWDISKEICFTLNLEPKKLNRGIEGETRELLWNNNFVLNINVDPENDDKGVDVELGLDVEPYTLRFGSDWFSNNGLNGYLTHFVSVPNTAFN